MTNNSKQQPNRHPKFRMFTMLAALFLAQGINDVNANRKAHHFAFLDGGHPEYYPVKHSVMSYSKQNRLAKKRRKARQ
jgi:hypothetical protein